MPDEKASAIESVINGLPDPQGARAFWERLQAVRKINEARDSLLASRLLTIAAYSPFLAEAVLRHPEYIEWLRHETQSGFDRVKPREELSDELARFLMRTYDTDQREVLARFKRRELLRIYLRDCLKIATLAEVTEELSNLADVILRHALALTYQEMTNRHGAPLTRDERGRIQTAEFAVVALGKLGCRELNYASDIDLLFLYAGEGDTAGDSRAPESTISNRVFFKGVAERITQMIGGNSPEGAVYRIDLRLRPYGRDGDLVWEIQRAADYYRNKAQNWERQALLRVRASAGSETVVARFLDLVRDVIFTQSPQDYAMQAVRRAKEKIDREVAKRGGGFNVKLGRGGIREIEFIAQALQLRYGGREPWLRSAQTLIVLARLAEKGYLSETERARLSAAYVFLRTIEHRLQMEHGAQTHSLPVARDRVALVARRCDYLHSEDAAADLLHDLEMHTTTVRAIYNRVFSESSSATPTVVRATTEPLKQDIDHRINDETARLVSQAVASLIKIVSAESNAHVNQKPDGINASSCATNESALERSIITALPSAINPLRSLRNLSAWGESCATFMRDRPAMSHASLTELITRLLPTLSSQHLAGLLIARPTLADALSESSPHDAATFYQLLYSAIENESSPAAKGDALRRAWHQQVIAIGYDDIRGAGDVVGAEGIRGAGGREPEAGPSADRNQGQQSAAVDQSDIEAKDTKSEQIKTADVSSQTIAGLTIDSHLRENNLTQTALAEAALRLAAEIALESLGVRLTPSTSVQKRGDMDVAKSSVSISPFLLAPGPRPPAPDLPFAILGLGRLGHAGMDYGSDLDLLVVFDDAAEWPPPLLASSADALKQGELPQEFYARFTSELVRVLSSITREGLLYRIDLRLRPEGNNGPLSQGLSGLVTYLTHRASAWEHSAYLKAREVAGNLAFGARAREAICEACFDAAANNPNLRDELASMRLRIYAEKAPGAQVNVKWGRGGMMDVYFITRYLQLREHIYYPPDEGTAALIRYLGERDALDAESTRNLFAGYTFLRRLDHWMRLLLDRPTPALPASHIALNDLAQALGIASIDAFKQELAQHLNAIHAVYDRVFAEPEPF